MRGAPSDSSEVPESATPRPSFLGRETERLVSDSPDRCRVRSVPDSQPSPRGLADSVRLLRVGNGVCMSASAFLAPGAPPVVPAHLALPSFLRLSSPRSLNRLPSHPCVCAVHFAAAMGSCLSSTPPADDFLDDSNEAPLVEKTRRRGRRPDDDYEQTPAAAPRFTKALTPSPPIAAPSNGAPRFTSVVRTQSSTVGRSGLFCRCGGPSTRIVLVPCGHAALCLSCAQLESRCPECNQEIHDTVPSFRVV